MKPQLFSGARGKITFTDSDNVEHILAFVTDVSISETAGLRPSFVIGNEGPKTIEPMSLDVNASIGRIVPMNKSTSSDALAATTAIDHRLEEKINEILQREHVTITISDTKSKDGEHILAVVKYARFSGRSTSLNSGDAANERFNFVGILDAGYGGTSNAPDDLNYGF